MDIEIKYHNPDLIKMEKINKGDWIDLRVAQDYDLKAGNFYMLDLGVSMKLPEGYEALVVPRSSTFKNWGTIQVNSVGVIDESYCGTNDVWKLPVYATRDTHISMNDRMCQFRIIEHMPRVHFKTVETLDDTDRGSFGSTGVN